MSKVLVPHFQLLKVKVMFIKNVTVRDSFQFFIRTGGKGGMPFQPI